MTKIILKKNEERRIKQGHLWVFSNEIKSVECRAESEECRVMNGELVEVYDFKNNFIGCGFYNANSLIAVRLISIEKEIDIKSLFEKRILQIYSAGMERNIETIVSILKGKFNAENIFTKNESYFRKLEGLPEEDKIYVGEMPEEVISDGFVKYKIDFANSHKTGFYFDQCDNREFVGKFSGGKSVLDCFCNSGGFGLHAAKNGAQSVTFVDSSNHEIENAKSNFQLNNFTNEAEFVVEDVFDFLEKCRNENRKFDIVNIDPPAFAKNKKSLPQAIKGYEKLNRLAMEIVNDGGLVFTSSCSHHLKEDAFLEITRSAAIKAGKKIQLFHFNNASMDHPYLPAMEETVYLKFAALKVTCI